MEEKQANNFLVIHAFITNSKILEDNLYTNVIGAGVVAKMKWGESNGKAKV